ncbi:hypothetical protein DFP94_104180 [Fontibacillus phaseoli]|uniref:Intracellular proteinase inhibitor BsuPI n=1 Tax=Fontibacillus phaseoli TaxID=1416533 RepID=A0A369BGN4_9BACL|nr:hypothetical protein [Fontibacillus phaseoli]RCX19726.1 hypothetical protein DFP94_104180 [Fontibacillus phaseoli]
MKNLVFILFLALMGCQSADLVPANNITNTEPGPSAVVDTDADHDFFSVKLSLPEQVKVNESFTIEAELKNTSTQTFEILTGKPVFYYVIRDNAGNSDPILRTDIGVVRPLDQNAAVLEKHPYRFKSPGVYEVSAVAEFSLQGEDDNNQVYKMETEPKQIEVIE